MWKLLLRVIAIFGTHKKTLTTTVSPESVSPSILPSYQAESEISAYDQTSFELQQANNNNGVVSVASSVRYGPTTEEYSTYYSFLKQGNIVYMRFGNNLNIPDGVNFLWDPNLESIPSFVKPYFNLNVPIVLESRDGVFSGSLLIYGNYSSGFYGFKCSFGRSSNSLQVKRGTTISWAVSPTRW